MTSFEGPTPALPSKVGGDPNRLGDRAEVQYRLAGAGDIEAVAGLHADSWRRHYRGAYLDSFLDGDVFADRVVVWGERLSESTSDSVTVVAVNDEAVVGFAHTILDDDPVCGARLDNLHVAYALKGHGVGTGLMAQTASALIQARSPDHDDMAGQIQGQRRGSVARPVR